MDMFKFIVYVQWVCVVKVSEY